MQQAGRRPALLFLWMVRKGCGVLPDNYFVLSSRRLNASCAPPIATCLLCQRRGLLNVSVQGVCRCRMDLEAEMGRFEMALDLELDKYRRMEPPVAPPPRQAVVAIDCLATCCCGALFVLPCATAPVHCVRSAAHLGSLSRRSDGSDTQGRVQCYTVLWGVVPSRVRDGAGLRDQVQIPQDDQKSLLDIAAVMFPDVPEDSLREAIANRSGAERKYER